MQVETPSPTEFYDRRTRAIDLAAAEANQRCGRYQGASLFLILAVLFVAYVVMFSKTLPAWTIVVPLAALVFARNKARFHGRYVLKFLNIGEYYGKANARLRRQWDSLDDGGDFIDRGHIYATDLDLFGRGSLFQLLCSARTRAGREALAGWMKNPATREEAVARQAAVSELRSRHDLREALAAAGKSTAFTLRPRTIPMWVDEVSAQRRLRGWIHPVAFVFVLALCAIPFLYWYGRIDVREVWLALGAWCAAAGAFAYIFVKPVKFMLESADSPSVELPIVADLLEIIEREKFSSRRLRSIAERVCQDGPSASHEVRRLHRLIRLLLLRNTIGVLSVVLWSTQFSVAIDRWHRRCGAKLIDWIDAIAEFEALISLSAYAFEHPADPFPEFVDESPLFDAQSLGHPLLDENTCVTNDVRLFKDSTFLIVSGSNMSGKSTFLRAVGSNAVLARMGAPVRCTRLRLSLLDVAAAIRVQDSLAGGQSHFFAEMERLRRMIDLATNGPLLFLVDEIMSGTNSKDRRIASEWVMRALIHRGAIGLITTHDLTLTEIASNGLPGRNVYFEDSGEGGELVFDYKLHSGLLTRSNALNIVRMLGINTDT